MRVPHESYVRFLITSGLDSEDTNKNLKELGLPMVSVDYWDRQYEALHDLKIPKKIKKFWKNPNRRIPNGFFEYMNVAGLREAWEYNCGRNKDFEKAIEVMQDFDISLITRAMIADKAPIEEIQSILSGKFVFQISKPAIILLKKYFFNVKIMSRVSWRLYLKGLTNEERHAIYLAITGESEELRAELSLPANISVSENFQRLHIFAMRKFSRYSKAGNPDSDAEAIKWAKLAMSTGDKYEKLKVSDASDFVKDIQMEFDQVETEFPTIGDNDLEEIKSNKDAGQNNEGADPIPYKEEHDE